jgi:hypothetical protein
MDTEKQENTDVIEEMDLEIQKLTGDIPKEFNVNEMFAESQEVQKNLYGGGEDNSIEKQYLEGIRKREVEIQQRKNMFLDELDEVEEVSELEEDGIIIRK